MNIDDIFHSYSISLVTQGEHKFYTLTVPSEILAKTCFISSREDDPKEGFQRLLDEKRAQQIADYIDNGLGTIPTAIILSAQPEAELEITGKGKTIKFKEHNKAFLILDGQHRVYGFNLAKSSVRIPVVIYNNLSRRDESRIFIDINTKQKPVPNELLFDIKNLAEYENNNETFLREIFDLFHESPDSILLGLTSSADKSRLKISRVAFNSALSLVTKYFGDKESNEVYEICNSYLIAMFNGLRKIGLEKAITNSTVFKSIISIFPHVAQRTKDKYSNYMTDSFSEILAPLFVKLKPTRISKPGGSYKDLSNYLLDCLKTDFTL
ncbi:DGQHR domain-containing protein [Sphingobacterium anhuiense]|uniref:DGQHR domain-containing protein n=1 Tax=Sphingobacterium anhuiense TaxID=493780 RepID=A0ABW5YV65_9SPHI